MSLKSKFSSEVYHARKEKDYTQLEASNALYISKRYFQRIEKGEKFLSTELLLEFGKFLDIDLNKLKDEVNLGDSKIHSNKNKKGR